MTSAVSNLYDGTFWLEDLPPVLHAVLAVPGGDQLPPDCPEACDLTSFDDSEGERDCGTLARNLQLLSKCAKQLSKYI